MKHSADSIKVPNLNTQQELAHVMQESGGFEQADIQRVISEIEQNTGSRNIGVGIQTVLLGIQTAQQDQDHIGRFAEVMCEAIADSS